MQIAIWYIVVSVPALPLLAHCKGEEGGGAGTKTKVSIEALSLEIDQELESIYPAAPTKALIWLVENSMPYIWNDSYPDLTLP